MAGLSNGGLSKPFPPRPPFASQASSSVPSTPHQQPHDIRFTSRSPSPTRNLLNQSPRSVASEAVGRHVGAPPRNTPRVCKFESGPEFRKRRIPYVEGGDKELGPPKKEPKRTLDPQEEGKLSGDMRELYDRLLPSEESEQRRRQLVQKLDRILNEKWPGNDIKVNVFGSSGNLLSSTDSDVDICVTTPLRELESMHSLATLLHSHGMERVECRSAAKVPIVKCWDPELMLAADLNVNNPLALENTRMIKTYVQLDERVRPLAKIVKYWTKQRILNDAAYGGTISSYTWICMIISFLQRRKPPLLPSLQKKTDCKRSTVNGQPSAFADDIPALQGCGEANKESLSELLFQFFRHYGYEFDYAKDVVSVREGRLLSRREKGWDGAVKEAGNRLCVEEPFNPERNLGNSADVYAWTGVHEEIRRAFDLLADGGRLAECCEQYEFPVEKTPVFQRPPPKPKPTLTRSASQHARANNESGTPRPRTRSNRNQSAQRAGNRRASSGASFSSQRAPLLHSPPPTMAHSDYFSARSNLHDQLFQQYQYLQAQQDALRSQLAQQSQGPSQVGPRAGDLAASPHQRQYVNGMTNGRPYDNPPPSAPLPLMPNYLYQYPAQYQPASNRQARQREGTNTNPSSPSMVAAVPALGRQIQRGPMPESSTGSIRSQSQPGRTLPNTSMPYQGYSQPMYDASGTLVGHFPGPRPTYLHQQGSQLPYPSLNPMHMGQRDLSDSTVPKEYMGYYVGQSPQMGPQYTANQMQPPNLTLRDPPPQRRRRPTPELAPPMPNGRHASRSPSPLGHQRSYSTSGQSLDTSVASGPPTDSEAEPAQGGPVPPVNTGAPLIVNGSTPSISKKPAEKSSGAVAMRTGGLSNALPEITNGVHHLPSRPAAPMSSSPECAEGEARLAISSSPNLRGKNTPRLSLSPNGSQHHSNGTTEHSRDASPLTAQSATQNAPLLSPVAELRTPSPTQQRAFEHQHSPQANGFVKQAQIQNARHTTDQKENAETGYSHARNEQSHTRKQSAPNPGQNRHGKNQSSTHYNASGKGESASQKSQQQNSSQWQQATGKRGHKKSKSAVPPKATSGQPMPANEAERKGG